jgi:Fic-DOC domain mobile mystery protein B
MGLDLTYEPGQTPLDEDEKEGLLIPSITTRGQLNEAEQLNIEEAITWTLRKKFKPLEILSEEFIRELHKQMYGDVWRWAGDFRKTNKNIGVDKFQIGIELKKLLDDAKYWLENKTYSEDEFAVRFKHRIVSIHCFPNGNGRHSRLIADVIVSQVFGRKVFTWGRTNLVDVSNARKTYLQALKKADSGDLASLIEFARG